MSQPYWVCVGDNDPATGHDVDEQLEVMLEVNGRQARAGAGFTTRFAPDEIRTGENYYTSARGYAQGERFRTLVYCGRDGSAAGGIHRDEEYAPRGDLRAEPGHLGVSAAFSPACRQQAN